MAIYEPILEAARKLADGELLMPSHVAEASADHHSGRQPDVVRHYALLDALDFLYTALLAQKESTQPAPAPPEQG